MLKPLTGTYTRPDAVRDEIEEILKQPLTVAFRLAAEGKLRPQTLVYLMRNFRPNRRTREHDNLVVAFLSRLERSGVRLIREFSEVDREKINGEVMDLRRGVEGVARFFERLAHGRPRPARPKSRDCATHHSEGRSPF